MAESTRDADGPTHAPKPNNTARRKLIPCFAEKCPIRRAKIRRFFAYGIGHNTEKLQENSALKSAKNRRLWQIPCKTTYSKASAACTPDSV